MASPVVTVVEDREDEPPHVYGALVGALSRSDAHTVHALLLETCAEGALDAGESSVFEAVKRVLEVNEND
jgi:hypothetical protein